MSNRIVHQGKTFVLDGPYLTPEAIKKHFKPEIDKKRKIAIAQTGGSELIPLDQIPPGTDLGNEARIKTYPSGTVKGDTNARREYYIKSHVASVADVYGERYGQPVQLDKLLRFVYIPCFTLPRKWGMRTTPLIIWFPTDYPEIPPNGFYLSKKCQGPHIFSRMVYGASPDLSSKGWNWFCVHCDAGWHPQEDPNKEDNLWTFLDVIRLSLSIAEF